jgi:hypothetical protein
MRKENKVPMLQGWTLGVFMLAGTLQAQRVPDYVQIERISYAGSGCRAGSVAEDVAPDRQSFTLMFDNYVAEVGEGTLRSDARKNCNINVRMRFPSGWSYSIVDLDYRGYVYLDHGITATQSSSYYFQGDSRTARFSSMYYGPVDRNYHFRDSVGMSATVWSPCGADRSLNINTAISINNMRNRFGSGLMSTDTIDGLLRHVYHMRWRRC